jgi:hypothetical protein
MAERLNRTLVELMRAMLVAKDLPKYLWAEAVNYATWLKNHLPSRAIPGHTPYDLIQQRKPDLSMAHEFGSTVYVLQQNAGKLEPKAEEALFVGVDNESKAYRVYWPTKHRVSVERNMTFAPPSVVVARDVLDEGESAHMEEIEGVSKECNAPSIQHIPNSSTTPDDPEPRQTRAWPAPGYYSQLQKGQTAAVAIENLREASELDLLDEEAHIHLALAVAQPEPTLQQALNGPDGPEWQEALDYELSQLEKLGTWEIVDAPRGVNIIPCHFVLATKRGPNGEKLKLRARLVANSQRQQYGVDFFETFVPTANMSTIHTVLTMAAQRDWEIHQVDVKSAYLYASLQEEIYMRAPPGYLKEGQQGKVLKLKRSLPGLKQVGFEWAEELAGAFRKMGFSRSQVDQAVYYRCTSKEHMVITVSVDDMAVTANRLSYIEQFKSQLAQFFEISDLGELSWLLGLKVTRDRVGRTITLSQKAYVETIVERFRLGDAKNVQTPMEPATSLSIDQSPGTHTELQAMRDIPYQRAIGSLMYAATSTHPDIAFTVATLSQFMRNPGKAHWEASK